MTHLHRSITPRTLHLQRRDTPERTGVRASAAAVSTTRTPGTTMRRVVVPLNAASAVDGARSGTPAPGSGTGGHAEHAAAAAAAVQPAPGAAPPEAAPRGAPLSVDGGVSSENLLRGAKVVRILHNGESYQLRATRHGKLILTK